MGQIHVIGAGLAGLSCALRLAQAGQTVTVYEAAGHAGGRCRSFFDEKFGRLIDNGNHLVMNANTQALAYLESIGSRKHAYRAAAGRVPLRGSRYGGALDGTAE